MTSAPSTSAHESDLPSWLAVTKLSRTDWRISDGRLDPSHPGYLLGYVEKLARDRYEIVWMTDPMRWAYVETFAGAIDAFRDGTRFTAPVLSERAPARTEKRTRWAR